jgi:hypothetical protein
MSTFGNGLAPAARLFVAGAGDMIVMRSKQLSAAWHNTDASGASGGAVAVAAATIAATSV